MSKSDYVICNCCRRDNPRRVLAHLVRCTLHRNLAVHQTAQLRSATQL